VIDADGVTRDLAIAHQLAPANNLEVLAGMPHLLIESKILDGNIG
jgi:hypothetical protein